MRIYYLFHPVRNRTIIIYAFDYTWGNMYTKGKKKKILIESFETKHDKKFVVIFIIFSK